jgi:hypothetical protein
MAKSSQTRKHKKLQDSGRSNSALQNKVHELIEYIESHYRTEDRIKRTFAAAALTGALGFLDEISEATGVPTEKKIEVLAQIYRAASNKIEELAGAQPDGIPLWEDRSKADWRMSPCRFVKLHYPSYGKGLASSDIKDKKLLRALWNYKTRYGWPENFDLPDKVTALDQLVDQQSSALNLQGLSNEPPHLRRRRERIYRAKRRRLTP